MKILLDTYSCLWFVLGDAKLSTVARNAIESPADEKLIIPASYATTSRTKGIPC